MYSSSMDKILHFFQKHSLFIIIAGIALAVLRLFDEKLTASLILIFFLTSIALFFVNKIKDEKQKRILSILFLIAFSLHVLAALFIFYGEFQPFSDGRGDYIQYHFTAVEAKDRLLQRDFSIKGLALAHYFPLIVGYLYYFFVPHMIIGQLLNAWLLALISLFVYLLARELGRSNKEAFITGLIVSFYPSLAFFGGLLLKDAFVVFFSTLALLLAIKLIRQFSLPMFAFFYFALMGLAHFRFFIILPLLFTFIFFWMMYAPFPIKKRTAYVVIMILLFGFLPIISTVGGKDIGYFGINEIKRQVNFKNIIYYRDKAYQFESDPRFENVEIVDDVSGSLENTIENAPQENLENTAPAGQEDTLPTQGPLEEKVEVVKVSEILEKIPEGAPLQDTTSSKDWGQDSSINLTTGNTSLEFIKNSILSFVYALLGPFPWQLRSLKHAFVLPEIVLWWACLFFIARGAISFAKTNYLILFPLLFGLLLIAIVSLYMTNFGLVTRLRMPAFVALIVLVPFGLGKITKIKIPLLEKYLT